MNELRVHREQVEDVYEPETLSDFIYRELRPGRGWVQVTVMDGFTITVEAGSVALEEEDSSLAH